MVEKEYLNVKLEITKDFFDWLWACQFKTSLQNAEDRRINSSKTSIVWFGGKYGTQFNTKEEFNDFNNVFDALLKEFNIPDKHKSPLLYFILFLNLDSEHQSITNNIERHLNESADFLIDLIINCVSHEETLEKNPEYEKITDAYTGEYFFAKKSLVELMTKEELSEYFPDKNHADDVIRYLRVPILNQELYIPEDLTLGVLSKRTLKGLYGDNLDNLSIPRNWRYEMFEFLINNMIEQHRQYDTQFYKDFVNENASIYFFKEHYKKARNKKISQPESLKTLCQLVGKYLYDHRLGKNYAEISRFLFKYLALFKAHINKQELDLPHSYQELVPFYKNHGIDNKTIEYRMKGVWGF